MPNVLLTNWGEKYQIVYSRYNHQNIAAIPIQNNKIKELQIQIFLFASLNQTSEKNLH